MLSPAVEVFAKDRINRTNSCSISVSKVRIFFMEYWFPGFGQQAIVVEIEWNGLDATYRMGNPSLGCPMVHMWMQVENAHITKVWGSEVCLVCFHIKYNGEKVRVINDDFAWTVTQNRSCDRSRVSTKPQNRVTDAR